MVKYSVIFRAGCLLMIIGAILLYQGATIYRQRYLETFEEYSQLRAKYEGWGARLPESKVEIEFITFILFLGMGLGILGYTLKPTKE